MDSLAPQQTFSQLRTLAEATLRSQAPTNLAHNHSHKDAAKHSLIKLFIT